ncbi:MAG: hypothetical protein ABW033_07150 [Acidimicrobiia bacterium]
MRTLRPEEEWARQHVEHALGVPVRQHDDGSADGMHDLDIVYSDRPSAAVEVTAAADGESIAAWKQLNGNGRWIEPTLKGGWSVTVDPAARTKRIKKELPDLLGILEGLDLELDDDEYEYHRRGLQAPLSRHAADLGVVRANRYGTAFPGSIYVTLELPPERTGGFVADTGDALATWIGPFLKDEDHADVRLKLHRAGAAERHAFVLFPTFATAPFGVTDLLMRQDGPLPTVAPGLPAEATHVWALGGWSSGRGMRWAPGSGWSYFDKL